MPTIGVDCEVIVDSTGYWVKPGSYHVKQPRIRKATVRADNGESYVDLGPGKREWAMIVLCKNELINYQGASTNFTGQQYRDALRTSYATVGATINFTDPLNNTVAVHFDAYIEALLDLKTQIVPLSLSNPVGASYEVAIVLVEA